MRGPTRRLRPLMSAALIGSALARADAPARAEDMRGCYERVYDRAFLAAHPGQFVERVTVSIDPASPQARQGAFRAVVADAKLRVWVHGRKMSFDSFGACSLKDGRFDCGGSLSAAETPQCRDGRAGLRQCRVDLTDAGGFQIEAEADGVLVSVPKRLELAPAPYDGPPFLNLTRADPQNHAFRLKPADEACP